MKHQYKEIIALVLLLLCSGCAQPSLTQTAIQPSVAPVIECAVYDSCTYRAGLMPDPVFECTSKTLQLTEHPEINASYFEGHTCLTYKEDYHEVQNFCGQQYLCSTSVQGPGPQAIPGLNL